MNRPDLSRAWETFVRINPGDDHIQIIRRKVRPIIRELTRAGEIGWYCFLIPNRESGVPTSSDDNLPYFHLRLEFRRQVLQDDVLRLLPSYCVFTRKIELARLKNIDGIDMGLLKDGQIAEAWRIIGEQSEWVLKVLDIHTAEGLPLMHQLAQFLHYFANMMQLDIRLR